MSTDPAATPDGVPAGDAVADVPTSTSEESSPRRRRHGVITWEVRPIFRLAFVLVVVLMVLSILASVAISFAAGGYGLAATLFVAAVMRLTLPPEYCLGLIVRSRNTDVITCLVLAFSLAALTRTVPGY